MPITATATHVTEHSIRIAAPVEAVYALIADASSWPQIFGPTVHVEVPEENDGSQLLRIWAFANGQVRNWTSRRTLNREAASVGFRQVVSAPPVASMGGEWRLEAVDGGTRVVLLHDYRAVDDAPASVDLIETAVDRNSRAELAALKAASEQAAQLDELCFTFSDSEYINGSAEDVFAFLARADKWPERLPHVARLDLQEDVPGLQQMTMETRGPDGTLHTTTSVRVCFADRGLIVYKQTEVPPVMSGHTGRWVIEPDGDGVRATSWHTVTLDPEGVRRLLGPDVTLAEARSKVRHALGANSSATLRSAKGFAE